MKTIGIVGGDLRIVRLAEMYVKEGHTVYTYGLENCEKVGAQVNEASFLRTNRDNNK